MVCKWVFLKNYDYVLIMTIIIIKSWYVGFPLAIAFLNHHLVEMFSVTGNYDSIRFNHYGNDEEFAVRSKKFGYPSLYMSFKHYLC